MIRKIVPLLFIAILNALMAQAQNKCATMTMYEKYKLLHPEIAQYEDQLSKEYHEALKKPDLSHAARTTSDPSAVIYDIPVVVHIIHNYGQEYLPDDSIYHMIAEMNRTYSLNYDTSATIAPFKKYVGKANIQFHLATKDPNGQPTKGITRHYSYLTYGGDDQAKFDLWAPDNYYNIWIENKIGLGTEGAGFVLAYANFPSSAAAYPYNDGVIAGYQFVNPNPYGPLTVEHETGHYFNLLHPWNNNGSGDGACGSPFCGDDDVDDTPPTVGHCSTCNLFDTSCAASYVKIYPSAVPGVDSLADYPDTTNVQNIMDYASCPLMFTKQQVIRMRAALNSSIGHRSTLWSNLNLYKTGIMDTSSNTAIETDMAPIADYSVSNHFVCANENGITFTNRSWNDTVIATNWTFSNGASISTSSNIRSVTGVTFSQPGWVSVTMAVAGNNTSTTTITDSQKVFVANTAATTASGYLQEFNQNGDLSQWPMFNYYNNNFKWKPVSNLGYYDNTSVAYTSFDERIFPDNVTGTPVGDMDDMYTPPFDLTGLNGTANPVSLNFMYSGATRTGFSQNISDTLEIDYNVNCGSVWTPVTKLTKSQIDNQGSIATAYAPQASNQWSLQSIALPAAAVTNHTIFRFRYKPGLSGNNFYMDRLNFSNDPLGLNTLIAGSSNIALAPNPTNGNTYVIVSSPANTKAQIQVTDITGKLVYTMQQLLNDKISRIEIPKTALSAAGMYLVHVSAGALNHTEKLVVY